jgi:hypothetical protein
MEALVPLDLPDRMLFAMEALRMRAEQRDGFVSDDDVLDAATAWSVDVLTAGSAWPDYDLLVDFLFEQVSDPIQGGE